MGKEQKCITERHGARIFRGGAYLTLTGTKYFDAGMIRYTSSSDDIQGRMTNQETNWSRDDF